MTWHHLWWVPLVGLYYWIAGYLSYKNNTVESKGWLIGLYLFGLVQLWPFVSRVSKNLIVDAMIYDFLIVFIGTMSVLYISGKSFSVSQWAGLFLAIVGILLVQKG